ncbi:caspase recruitment domain-containing protein 8-like [Porphyrio hochstetteri]
MEDKQLKADSPDSFSVFIHSWNGKTFSVLVSLDDTVRDLKSKLNAQDFSLTPETGWLIFSGKQLEDEQTLRHYQITPNCILHHVRTLRGGGLFVELQSSGSVISSPPVDVPWKPLMETWEIAVEDFVPQGITEQHSEDEGEGMAAAAGSHLEQASVAAGGKAFECFPLCSSLQETYYMLNQGSPPQGRCQHCTQEDLPQLMPEITQDLLKHRTIYQAHIPGAGIFQCHITGLSFKVKSAVTITYRYTSWTRHLSKADQELWVPAGPLFNIKAQPEVVQAVYLPHFICLAEAVDTSLCSIAHFKSGIMTLERPTSLVAFSAVLENPSFSLLGVLWRRLRSTLHSFPAHSLVLIFQLLSAANTTLHLYLIPDDNSVKQAIERQESNWNSKVIPKPSPFSPLFFGCDYWVTSNNSVVITPEPRLPFCYKSPKEQQHFLEIYIKNMAEEMELRMTDKRNDTVVWRASLRSGAAFLQMHKTDLCCRMSQISTILLHLRDANVINSDEEEQVQVQPTSKRKNRILLEMVEKKGVEAQEQLYRILQEKDPFLIEHLEMS